MIPPEHDFQRLKSCVSIEMVLAAKGLRSSLTHRGGRLIGPCPIHGGDNPTAFVVTPSKGLWHCFTRCDTGGDVVSLVQKLDRASFTQAATYLAGLACLEYLPPVRLHQSHPFKPFTHSLPLRHRCPFLAGKGITGLTAAHFEAGAYFGSGFLWASVAVRLHDLHGNPLGYAARRLKIIDGIKWRFPPKIPKSQCLFNWHRIQLHHPPCVVVTECPWGVMRLHQLGIPAVALLGTHLSSTQRQLLSLVPSIILLLDGDPAGRQAAQKIRDTLSTVTQVYLMHMPNGLDPDDLADFQLAALLHPFFL